RVVYIEVEEGRNQLRGMHQSLNREAFHFVEEYQYHPHLTLAQDFPEAELRRIEELAKQRWREFRGPRRFRAGELVFVQNRNGQGWADLETISMGQVPAK
ncbi:MAG: hypothetical protein FJW37_07250, partial [Acidobacteria bacterium]|nr:hypothetical protein [Acidobacteriota bacterium]